MGRPDPAGGDPGDHGHPGPLRKDPLLRGLQLHGWQLQKALRVCEANGFVKPVSQQILYSAYTRTAEYEQIPSALDAGISTQPWSPLNMGLLTGKWRRGRSPRDRPA